MWGMRILLVDDHPVVRSGLRALLLREAPTAVVGEAADPQAAMAAVRSQPWDVVVLDITLGPASGLDVLRDIHREKPGLPVLMLSVHPAAQFERRALAAGASGYLTKDCAAQELVRAIQRVRRGHTLSPSTDVRPRDARLPHELLSDREYQVLRMLGSGRTVSQIGASLSISVKTVSTYRARILEKLNMTSNAELMRYALENHLLDD